MPVTLPPMGPVERVRALLAAHAAHDDDVVERVLDLMPEGERLEVAAIIAEREAALLADPIPDCPECAAGKHPNCDGGTWDPVADEPAACPCASRGHVAPTGRR